MLGGDKPLGKPRIAFFAIVLQEKPKKHGALEAAFRTCLQGRTLFVSTTLEGPCQRGMLHECMPKKCQTKI